MTMPGERRPWGTFEVLLEDDGYKVKRITLDPKSRISHQSHEHRSERWTVVRGRALVIIDDVTSFLEPGDVAVIERGQRHRLENREDVPLVVVEVQLGDYLGEDDIRRYEDDYERT